MVCRVRGSIRPFIFASRTGAFRRAVPGRRPPPTRSRDRSPRRSLRDVWLGLTPARKRLSHRRPRPFSGDGRPSPSGTPILPPASRCGTRGHADVEPRSDLRRGPLPGNGLQLPRRTRRDPNGDAGVQETPPSRGILILDLTNFDAWIRNPMNARADVDEVFPDGVRVIVFGLNDQVLRQRIHYARFITTVKQRQCLDLRFSEAPLRIWRQKDLGGLLRRSGFGILGWAGDLRIGRSYSPRTSPRLVAVAVRR